MNAFIDDYIAWVSDLIGDPAGDVRTTTEKRLRDLHAHHMSLYERFLRTSEEIGYSEQDYSIVSGTSEYILPGSFRRFIRLEKRVDGDPNAIEANVPSIPRWKMRNDTGVIIEPHASKMTFVPVPVQDEGTYTLCFQRQPVLLHKAKVSVVNSEWIYTDDLGSPTIVGDINPRSQYYLGEYVFPLGGAFAGIPHEITASGVGAGPGSEVSSKLGLKVENNPLLPGDEYELRPIVPRGLDKIIALSVALGRTSERMDPQRRGMLKSEWNEMFAACMHFLRSQATDMKRLPKHSTWMDSTIDPMAGP